MPDTTAQQIDSVTVDETFDDEGNLISRTTTTQYKPLATGGVLKKGWPCPGTPIEDTFPKPLQVGDVWPYGNIVTVKEPEKYTLMNNEVVGQVYNTYPDIPTVQIAQPQKFPVSDYGPAERDAALEALDGGGFTDDPYLEN